MGELVTRMRDRLRFLACPHHESIATVTVIGGTLRDLDFDIQAMLSGIADQVTDRLDS
jgi:hypothetical protein